MSNALASSAVQFKNESVLKEHLARKLRQGSLALLVGSGISLDIGLPSWEGLLTRMLEAEGVASPTLSADLLEEAELFERKYCKGDYGSFVEKVRTALYATAELSFHSLRQSDTLAAIAALVMASRRGSAVTVTFNGSEQEFDCLDACASLRA